MGYLSKPKRTVCSSAVLIEDWFWGYTALYIFGMMTVDELGKPYEQTTF